MGSVSASKAFRSIDQNITCSADYTIYKKQKTKYNYIQSQALTGKAGLKKLSKWNNNVHISSSYNCDDITDCQDISNCYLNCDCSGCYDSGSTDKQLISTNSYEELLDLHKGKLYSNPVLNGSTKSDVNLYVGVFATVSFSSLPEEGPIILLYPYNSDYSIISPTDNFNKIYFPNNSQVNPNSGSNVVPGYIADPYGTLYLDKCNLQRRETARPNSRLINNAKLDFRWLIAYWQLVKGNSLNGFRYPTKISFLPQTTNLNNSTTIIDDVQSLAPLPISLLNKIYNNQCSSTSCDITDKETLSNKAECYQYNFWDQVIKSN